MGSIDEVMNMPLCRFVALYIGSPDREGTSGSLTEIRNRQRARKGLPPVGGK